MRAVLLITPRMRRPVVTSDLQAFRLIVERSGTGLVCPTDEDYAATILRLLNNRELRQDARINAERYVRERAGWSLIARRHAEVYERIIEPYGTGRYVYFPEPVPKAATEAGNGAGSSTAAFPDPFDILDGDRRRTVPAETSRPDFVPAVPAPAIRTGSIRPRGRAVSK